MPIHREALNDGDPSDDAIGAGLYDYLRQYPDCEHNTLYAELLRDAYPHYLADLGAHILMLDHREVDAPYISRKLTAMKILSLLDPENPALLQQMGIVSYDLALTLSELPACRRHLLSAMGYFQRALRHFPNHLPSLNYLGQIDYLLGDYPSALRRWQGVVDQLPDSDARQALMARIGRIEEQKVPATPLIDDLEAMGEAMLLAGEGHYRAAADILNRLDEAGTLPAEFPQAEFYYLLGLCRRRCGDPGGAFEALELSLAINPGYAPSLEERDRILDGEALL